MSEQPTQLESEMNVAEQDVDDRDAPNVYPYKKCSECQERKSCGCYVEDNWLCEDCVPEEEEEKPEKK